MLLTEDQTDQQSLLRIGAEAAALLVGRDFCALADRFGYALAYDRKVSDAIEVDLASCLAQADQELEQATPWQTVKYFKPNATNLFAVVEYVARMPEGPAVLVELIVSGDGSERHITLEDISLV
ncbi:hypothetical protein [Dyella subtropica]|uniref:hypothetical protein n=1 Tax=Dyella subtropica TaxID=2992127 RepID=UPI0022535CE3|nr:hypothetical protein [Dyella subtropica]